MKFMIHVKIQINKNQPKTRNHHIPIIGNMIFAIWVTFGRDIMFTDNSVDKLFMGQ